MTRTGLSLRAGALQEVVADLADDGSGLVLLVGGGDVERRLPTGDAVAVASVAAWARERAAAARDRRVRTLSPVVRERAIRAALRDAEDGPLARLARRTLAGDSAEAVATELEAYYRCTDAAREADHEALLEATDAVAADRPFAAAVTEESLRAFRALDGRLRRFVAERDDDGRTFVSRSHLLRAARDRPVEHDRVVVVPHEPVDAAVLRSAVAVAAETHVTLLTDDDRLVGRAEQVAAAAGVRTRRETGDSPASVAGRRLLAAARNRPTTAPETVRSVAVPDRRREVEYAVRAAARTEGRALLVAPDPDAYAHALRDVARALDRPHRVGTPRRVGTLPVARTLRAVLALAAAEDPVAAETVLDPLRLGAVAPDRPGTPVSTATVERLRETLPETAPLREHRAAVAAEDAEAALAFLEWVDAVGAAPPEDGRALRETLLAALDAHVAALRAAPPRPVEGLAVDRSADADAGPAETAARVRAAVEGVAPTYDRLDGVETGWGRARTALRAALAAETRPPPEAGAVEMLPVGDPGVDAVPVEHLLVLGLSAERFPRTPRRPTLLHAAVREAVARGAAGPAAHLGGETARYRRELDALGRALRAVAPEGRVTLLRPYKDEEGRDVPPSPVLEALSVPDERRERVALDEWPSAPVPGDDPDPERPAERLRAVARGAGAGGDREATERLAAAVDPERARRLLRRVERFEHALEDENAP